MRAQPNMKPDLLSVIEKYTREKAELGKAICCPFHKEHDPSLHIYKDMHWYCFGCGKTGDAYDFVGYLRYGEEWNCKNAEMFITVLRELEESSCRTVLYDKFAEQEEQTLPKELFALLRWCCSVYHQALLNPKDPDAAVARNYLKKRGYDENIIRKLKIGFSSKNLLMTKARTLSREQRAEYITKLKTLGLIKISDDGIYEYYRNRIMFPNVTKEGDVINLTGRSVGKSNRRYLNIPNIKKDLYLIGMMNPAYPVYLTESVTDTVSMWQLGYQTVATNGTALSKRMAASLDGFADIRIVPQNDIPSVTAAGKWTALVPRCRIVLPEYIRGVQKDVNDILTREGAERAGAKIDVAARHPIAFREYAELVAGRLS